MGARWNVSATVTGSPAGVSRNTSFNVGAATDGVASVVEGCESAPVDNWDGCATGATGSGPALPFRNNAPPDPDSSAATGRSAGFSSACGILSGSDCGGWAGFTSSGVELVGTNGAGGTFDSVAVSKNERAGAAGMLYGT